MNIGLRILKPGPLTLIQDKGRRHFQDEGLAQSGACDMHAYCWANHLLSNDKNNACLEITLGPFIAEFQKSTIIAICGADLNCNINNIPVPNWQSHRINKGDVIDLRPGNNGLRAYIAVDGGFKSERYFSSRSEVRREQLFAPQVSENAIIAYQEVDPSKRRITSTPIDYIPDYKHTLALRTFPSYQHTKFSEHAREILFSSEYVISAQADRMGYRLQGKEVAWTQGNIISEGTALGSIQIPPDGQPIVLLNDRQTIGGYPKIGCVSLYDCAQLSQRRPGQKVTFSIAEENTFQPSWLFNR